MTYPATIKKPAWATSLACVGVSCIESNRTYGSRAALFFVTIKNRSRQVSLSAPVVGKLLLVRKAKQQRNEVDKDVQLFPVYLNNEGFVANLHWYASFLPPKPELRGLIALIATCDWGSHTAHSTTLQSATPKRKQLHPKTISAEAV